MKEIHLKEKYEGDWVGSEATDMDYDLLLEESARVYKPDGSHLLTFVKGAVSTEVIKLAWPHLSKWNPKTDNRGTSTGAKHKAYLRKDGTPGKSLRIPKQDKVTSGVMGYYDRYVRIPFCRKCAWNQKNPEGWSSILPVVQAVSASHEKHCNEFFERQKKLWEQTSLDFKIPETAYTTVTFNKNYRTAYHYDGANLEGVVSAMLYIRQGKIKGGYTVFPEYRVAASMDTGDVIMFDGQGVVHGNTPISLLSKNAQRCTMVHYFRAGMVFCGTAEEELERAKNRKEGDPIKAY